MEKIKVLGCGGCGSAIAEMCLTLAEIPYEREEMDQDHEGPSKTKLFAANPLGEVPTLLLPDGTVLTETLAVAHYAQASRPAAGLLPKNVSDHARFYRWAVFLVSALYPTWTYGDRPARWVSGETAGRELRASTDEWRKQLWPLVEAEVRGPFFLGDEMTVIDLYLAVMSKWRPGAEWFAQHCPRIAAVRERVRARPELAPVWRENFSE